MNKRYISKHTDDYLKALEFIVCSISSCAQLQWGYMLTSQNPLEVGTLPTSTFPRDVAAQSSSLLTGQCIPQGRGLCREESVPVDSGLRQRTPCQCPQIVTVIPHSLDSETQPFPPSSISQVKWILKMGVCV